MRAAVLTEPGRAPAFTEHPDPADDEGTTTVAMTAAPIVPLDQLCASGTSYFGRPAVPYVPGTQGVGVVVRSGAFAPGTRVFLATTAGILPGDGSLAERCAVPDDAIVPVPDGVGDVDAAALGLSAVAAWMCLTDRGRLQPGETVLVLGAGRVVAVCRSEEAQARARRAGADEVVPLSGDVDELVARLAEACGGAADLVVDPVFGAAATAASRVLAPAGRLVNLGGASGDEATFSSSVLRGRSAEVLGYTNNALTAEQRAQALTAVAGHAAAGRLAVAHEVVPLSEVPAAWQRQAAGDAGVRFVLTP